MDNNLNAGGLTDRNDRAAVKTTSQSSAIAATEKKTRPKATSTSTKGGAKARTGLIYRSTSRNKIRVPLSAANEARLRSITDVISKHNKSLAGVDWEYLLDESITVALMRLETEIEDFLGRQKSAVAAFTG